MTNAMISARFASALRRQRLARGLTSAALSLEVGRHVTHVSRLESGRVLPDLSTVIRLCNTLRCPLSALLPDKPLPRYDPTDRNQVDDQPAAIAALLSGERRHRGEGDG